mmetsp:Transcript_111775/g.360828  ORF Transcript_111775/g.360828 Transcript_111775/m.360828 type:complete len:235 (+) Transcript_111775:548-1252(+)
MSSSQSASASRMHWALSTSSPSSTASSSSEPSCSSTSSSSWSSSSSSRFSAALKAFPLPRLTPMPSPSAPSAGTTPPARLPLSPPPLPEPLPFPPIAAMQPAGGPCCPKARERERQAEPGIVLTAVRSQGMALLYAAGHLREDPDVLDCASNADIGYLHREVVCLEGLASSGGHRRLMPPLPRAGSGALGGCGDGGACGGEQQRIVRFDHVRRRGRPSSLPARPASAASWRGER